jgi:hypothetical protein
MDHLSRMPVGAAIVVGAVIGLALGIVVVLTADPLAPEVGCRSGDPCSNLLAPAG